MDEHVLQEEIMDEAVAQELTQDGFAEETVAEKRLEEKSLEELLAVNKAVKKQMRRQFNPLGWSLVIYYLLMNVVVAAVAIVDVALKMIFSSGSFNMLDLADTLMTNGWGYILTTVIGFLILLAWKKKGFIKEQIFCRGKPMTVADFLSLLCLFMSGQLVFQLIAMGLEWILNQFGGSVMEAIESASVSTDTLSMLLYVGVVAPITEEILFRGLILRGMRPYGDKFAIVMSAFLFGMFHGNPVQTPYAFAVGLVLGYTALEYNISWAMLLHMLNNLVLGDMLPRLTSGLGEIGSAAIVWIVIFMFSIAALVVMICRWREIRQYSRKEKMDRRCVGAFFSSAGIIAILVLTCLNCLVFLVPLFV